MEEMKAILVELCRNATQHPTFPYVQAPFMFRLYQKQLHGVTDEDIERLKVFRLIGGYCDPCRKQRRFDGQAW